MLIPICASDKYVDLFARYSKHREWDSWAHKPLLTQLSLVCSPGPFVVLCILSIAYSTLLN